MLEQEAGARWGCVCLARTLALLRADPVVKTEREAGLPGKAAAAGKGEGGEQPAVGGEGRRRREKDPLPRRARHRERRQPQPAPIRLQALARAPRGQARLGRGRPPRALDPSLLANLSPPELAARQPASQPRAPTAQRRALRRSG